MLEIVAYFLAGSFSLGYGAARIGFPKVQDFDTLKKIGIGFGFGVVFFGLSAGLTLLTGNNGTFFLITAFIIGITYIGLLTKRIFFGDVDTEIALPNKGYTRTEQGNYVEPAQNVNEAVQKPAITFEQGLMVKTNGKEQGEGARVFKEKESNILKTISTQTNNIEEEGIEKKKREALERLRKSARQIEDANKEEGAEDEEELLTAMDEQLNKENEEY